MKIAYVTSQYPFGPGEAFLHAEAEALSRLSGDVVVIPTRPKTRQSQHADLTARVLRLGPWAPCTFMLAALEASSHPRRALKALIRVLATPYRPSTKVKNLALFPMALAVARAIRAERIEHVHAHWLSTPSTVAYVAATMTGVKWSCTAHRFDIFEDNLLTQKVSSAAFVRAISARNRDLIVSLSGDGTSARCPVVHLGVDLPQHASPLLQNATLRILSPAALVPVKGHRHLIEALAILRSSGVAFTCDLVGDGPLRKTLQDQIASLGLSGDVHLRGAVAHDRLMGELTGGTYDVVVLASTESGTEFEGIPVALMEAMAAGIPCVATDTGSISELIDDAACSTLVAQRDPKALAAAIAAHVDVPRRRQLGERARERVVKAFDVRETTRQLYRMMCAS
ncbi:MAG TPA: glycosyltransferase [Candidatus Dormibacteraeota bacterium]|nr:glycosyltransferase [Candidatus Dormibacteraeota bacterium]